MQSAWAGQGFPAELTATLKRYTTAKSTEITLEKKVTLAVLGKETLQTGKAFLMGNKLRLELDEPNRSLVVVDPLYVWVVSYPTKELGGDVQIGKARRSAGKQPPVLLNLLSQKNPDKDFRVVQKESVGPRARFELEPRKANPDFKKIRLEIRADQKEITALTYWDELDNQTQFSFSKTVFGLALDKKLFVYQPPKGAKVMEY